MTTFRSRVLSEYTVVSTKQSVYHVTYANRLPEIARRGLTPNAPRSIGSAGYDAHSKGRVFFTHFDGVAYWMERAEAFAEHNSEHPLSDLLVPVVLSTDIAPENLEHDELGTKDAHAQAWFITKRIPAWRLALWDGSEWTDIKAHDSLDYALAFDLQEPEEDEGDEPLEYFKSESPFLPREP